MKQGYVSLEMKILSTHTKMDIRKDIEMRIVIHVGVETEPIDTTTTIMDLIAGTMTRGMAVLMAMVTGTDQEEIGT